MRIFIDTNVAIDFLVATREQHRAAARLFEQAATRGDSLAISAPQATDLYYMLRRIASDQEVRASLRELFAVCDVLPATSLACTAALDSNVPDYEDAVQIEIARMGLCDYLATRDENDYANSAIPALSPAALLEELKRHNEHSAHTSAGDR